MSWKISKSGEIQMTRGDTPSIIVGVNIRDEDGNLQPYVPIEGDKIVFAMKQNADDKESLLTKMIPNDTRVLQFLENDTKDLDFGTYIYEISLNSGDYHCTFIANKKIKITTEIY